MAQYIKTTGGYYYKTLKNGKASRVTITRTSLHASALYACEVGPLTLQKDSATALSQQLPRRLILGLKRLFLHQRANASLPN